jgi:hypothetical protein
MAASWPPGRGRRGRHFILNHGWRPKVCRALKSEEGNADKSKGPPQLRSPSRCFSPTDDVPAFFGAEGKFSTCCVWMSSRTRSTSHSLGHCRLGRAASHQDISSSFAWHAQPLHRFRQAVVACGRPLVHGDGASIVRFPAFTFSRPHRLQRAPSAATSAVRLAAGRLPARSHWRWPPWAGKC